MIGLVHLEATGERQLRLSFSDSSSARWSADAVIARDTVLTRPLADPSYFGRAFIEAGALAWPNGLAFSSMALHRKSEADGSLVRKAA